MPVKDWMSTELVTVNEDTSVMEASQLCREKGVRRLPVLNKKGRLVGMVSDRDIKEASPSKATTLDVHELYYLLSKLKIKDIMSKTPITIGPDETIEKAAVVMLKRRISGLPVLDSQGNLIGLLTQGDVFRVLTSITGIYQGGVLFAFELEDRPGSIKEVADVIRKTGGRLCSILTHYENAPEGKRIVHIRVLNLADNQIDALTQELSSRFVLLYTAKDELKDT